MSLVSLWVSRVRKAILLLTAACAAAGCRAQPASTSGLSGEPFEPVQTRTFRDFGARGDGRADDSAALARAFENSDRYCLEGEGRTYLVSGTVRVTKSLCMRNATVIQTLVPFDTRPYIVSSCPVTHDAAALVDCGDLSIPQKALPALEQSLSVRTLLIRPDSGARPIRVNIKRVKVDRGPYQHGGSRTDSAGIWLEAAERVDMRDVEITGHGKGFGLLLIRSKNVTLTGLNIHDLVWSPYQGDAHLLQSRAERIGWNSVPIREFRSVGSDGAKASKFYGVRVQEQIACAFLAEVRHVRIKNLRISRCMAQFRGRRIPWQADGLNIGHSSSDISVEGGRIDSTWEGVDVVATGAGVQRLTIDDLAITNSFSFGLKLGYLLNGTKVTGLTVSNAGLAGIVIYGPVKNTHIRGAAIKDVGLLISNGLTFAPWPGGGRAGILLDEGSRGTQGEGYTPFGTLIEDVIVSNSTAESSYEFGVMDKGSQGLRTTRFRATGFTEAQFRVTAQPGARLDK